MIKLLEYIESAYLHGLSVENQDTGELEPPRDISEVAWIEKAIKNMFLGLLDDIYAEDASDLAQQLYKKVEQL